jgi:anti-sigma-K factor RskA
MEHHEYQELLALHALDALEASDARALEEHLGTCAPCRAELIELRDAAGLLAHTAAPAEPRAGLREQILRNIPAASDETSKTPAQVVRLADRSQSGVWPNLARIAAAIAMVALLIGIFVLWRRDVRLQREIAGFARQLNAQQRELARDRDLLARQREALAMLNAPGAKKMELAGTETARTARATFVFDPKTGHAMLMTEGLPATPADKAYEVWFIPKGRSPMAGKMFTVDSSGHAMIMQEMPPEALEHAVVAITLEPKKGSAVPTGAIYLSSPSS